MKRLLLCSFLIAMMTAACGVRTDKPAVQAPSEVATAAPAGAGAVELIAVEDLVDAYARYMNNEITATNEGFGNETLTEYYLNFYVSADDIPSIERFCVYDWDGDGVPELYFYEETPEGYKHRVSHIYWENGYLHNDSRLYSWINLRDDGLLFKAGPTLEGFYYWWWGYKDGVEIYAECACYDHDHDGEWDTFTVYDVVERVDYDVTKAEWDELTAPYFAEGKPIVEWIMGKDFDEWYNEIRR